MLDDTVDQFYNTLCCDFWDQVDEVDDSFEDNTREETLQFS